MSAINYEEFIGSEYPHKKGIHVSIFSQPFPLNAGDNGMLAKSMFEDKYGARSDIDAEYLKHLFKERIRLPQETVVDLKNQQTKEEVKEFIRKLGQSKEADKYDIFFFVFLTYISSENTGSTVYRDERIHLYDGLCHMQDFYDEVKKAEGLKMKPKLFLIQSDDISLLYPIQYIKGNVMTAPFKIPQDADRLVIMSDIPQRISNPDVKADEKKPSFMIEAFGETLFENLRRNPEERQDLLSLTTLINFKVRAKIDQLKGQKIERAEDMRAPLVTSTLTKLVKI